MTRIAILAAVLLAGCVASPEQEEQARDGIDAWQTWADRHQTVTTYQTVPA